MILGEPDPYNRPQEVAENKALFGVRTVLDFLGGQRLAFIGRVISGGSTTPEVLADIQEVLVRQLGHKVKEAKELIAAALKRNANITTAEELFEEVYRGEAG